MKKLSYLFLFIIAVTLFSYCKKDKKEETTPVNYITNLKVTINRTRPVVREKVTLTIRITSNAGLDSLNVRTFAKDTVVLPFNKKFGGNTTDSTIFYRFIVPTSSHVDDTIIFITKLTSKNAPAISDTHMVIVKNTPSPYDSIRKWTTPITLVGQVASGNGFFASINGNTYDQSEANANAGIIDITYGVITSGGESFISPSERGIYGFIPVTGGTITYFGLSSISSSAFDLLVNDSLITDIDELTLTDKKVSISSGNVYDFINSAGKKGVIKVNSIVPGSSGNVVIEVKVQQ